MSVNDFLFSIAFWGFVPVLLFSLLLTVALAFVVRFIIKRRFDKKEEKQEEAEEESAENSIKKRLGRFLGRFFARYGYSPQESLGRTFSEAFQILKLYTGSKDYRYHLPFYVMIGAQGTGKKEVLRNLKIPLPVERFESREDDTPCDFWFFDNAVVLNIEGSLLIEKEATLSRDEEWRLFLNLLLNARPGKPTDGLILCISVEELLSCTEQDLVLRANYVHEKIQEAQLVWGLKLPVYILVTQTDRIAGFSSFCHEIPPDNRDDIFGWSTPYALELPFNDTWIDEIFDDVSNQLIRLQQSIFTTGKMNAEKEGMTLFPQEFQRLKQPLGTYLTCLFQKAKINEGLFLRGVFFTGNGDVNYAEAHNAIQERLQGNLLQALPAGQDEAQDLQQKVRSLKPTHKKTIYFVTALFKDKIFVEQGLTAPFHTQLLSRNNVVKLTQVSSIVLAVGGSLGIFYAYNHLSEVKRSMMPRLDDVGHVIQRALTQNRYEMLEQTFFQKQAQALLPAIASLSVERLNSWLIPFSWMSPLETKIYRVIEIAYQQVIFKAIFQKINHDISLLVKGQMSEGKVRAYDPSLTLNPLKTRFFAQLYHYVTQLALYQSMAEKFNNLKNSNDMSDFGFLVHKLFGYKLPQSTAESTGASYTAFLNSAQAAPLIGFYASEDSAQKQFNRLKARFLSESFQIRNMVPVLDQLTRQLKNFSTAGKHYTFAELRKLAKTLSQSANLFLSPQAKWLSQHVFNPGPAYKKLVKDIAFLNFFSIATADRFETDCQAAFNQLRGILMAYSSPVTGRFFVQGEDGTLTISPSVLNFQGLLNLLLSQSFMKSSSEELSLLQAQARQLLIWHPKIFQQAAVMIQEFDTFFESRLGSLSEEVRLTLKRVCLSALRKTVRDIIRKAQEIVPQDQHVTTIAPEETYLAEVQNLRGLLPKVTPLLASLKQAGLNDLYTELRDILHVQSLAMLEKINAIYESEGPYDVRADLVARWTGNAQQIFAAFGASSLQDLKNYLALQRERLRYLAKEFAEPAVEILKKLYASDASSMPTLMLKWSDVLTQLDAYARNRPNTLQMLEAFILTTLPEMTLEGCPVVLHLAKGPSGIDYFIDRLNGLRSIFERQCLQINEKASLAAYNRIARFFNTHLAGRYPFVPNQFDKADEATIESIKAFFTLFDREGPYVKELLRKEISRKPHYQKALAFIMQLERVRPFFRIFTAPAGEDADPAAPLEVTFRTNKDEEKNAAHIIAWQLMSGDETRTFKDEDAKLWWHYDTDLKINFRWASGSMYRPSPSPQQPAMKVEPLQVSFVYEGPWALIKMLQAHKAASQPEDMDGLRLKFQIPTTGKGHVYPNHCGGDVLPAPQSSELLVFMDVKLNDGPAASSLEVPLLFPTAAPTLSELELSVRKKARRAAQNKKAICNIPRTPKS